MLSERRYPCKICKGYSTKYWTNYCNHIKWCAKTNLKNKINSAFNKSSSSTVENNNVYEYESPPPPVSVSQEVLESNDLSTFNSKYNQQWQIVSTASSPTGENIKRKKKCRKTNSVYPSLTLKLRVKSKSPPVLEKQGELSIHHYESATGFLKTVSSKTKSKKKRSRKINRKRNRKRNKVEPFTEWEQNVKNNYVSESPSNYKCTLCNFTCSGKNRLIIHQRIHTGEKPYKCRYCNYRGNQAGNVRNHEKRHTDKGMLDCEFCKFETSKWVVLKKHLVNEHGKKGSDLLQVENCRKSKVSKVKSKNINFKKKLNVTDIYDFTDDDDDDSNSWKIQNPDSRVPFFPKEISLPTKSADIEKNNVNVKNNCDSDKISCSKLIVNGEPDPSMEFDDFFFVCGLCEFRCKNAEECLFHAESHISISK